MKHHSVLRFWERHELFGVAFKSQSCWDRICPSYPTQQGMVRLSTSLPLYSAVCIYQESEIPKRNLPKKHTTIRNKSTLLPHGYFFKLSVFQYVTHVFPSIKNFETPGPSGHIHSTSEQQSNLLDPTSFTSTQCRKPTPPTPSLRIWALFRTNDVHPPK